MNTPVDTGILDALVEQLADAVADRLATRLAASGHGTNPVFALENGSNHGQNTPSPWLNVDGAAEHLACPVSRIYDLVQRRAVPVHRDGKRLLFKRSDLDHYLEGDTDVGAR